MNQNTATAELPNTDANGKQNRRGAPAQNSNRTSHGLRGYLTIGSFPKGAGYIRRQLSTLGAQLNTAIIEADGEITLYKGALIQSSLRHEGRGLLAQRWLRTETELALSDRLALMKTVTDATDSRDKCLRLLGLDMPPKSADPWAILNSPPPASHVPAAPNALQPVATPNASQANVGDSEASDVHPDYTTDDEAGT